MAERKTKRIDVHSHVIPAGDAARARGESSTLRDARGQRTQAARASRRSRASALRRVLRSRSQDRRHGPQGSRHLRALAGAVRAVLLDGRRHRARSVPHHQRRHREDGVGLPGSVVRRRDDPDAESRCRHRRAGTHREGARLPCNRARLFGRERAARRCEIPPGPAARAGAEGLHLHAPLHERRILRCRAVLSCAI